ncbi:MAG: transcription termination factor NusA [Lachnospiraceae bacterium]
MNSELLKALDLIEKEKSISKEVMCETIEQSLIAACKTHFGKADNIIAKMDRTTGDFLCYAVKEVVEIEEDIADETLQIELDAAKEIFADAEIGGTVNVEVFSKDFGRIAAKQAKDVILHKIREEEKVTVFNKFHELEHEVVTGIVQRGVGRNISIEIEGVDALLLESEQAKDEVLLPTTKIKVYITEVKQTTKGPRINVSRKHPELVKRLFETEVTEIYDGTVQIMSISREAGSRTKMSVRTLVDGVDAVGACVGVNGTRVNNIVEELRGEKIDIVPWDENPGTYIQNALAPSKVVAVFADPDERTAKVVVPDYQLSLAIGKEGQNARLAAKLTGFKIDIKSETQARDVFGFRYEDYLDEDSEYEEYDEYEEFEEGIE